MKIEMDKRGVIHITPESGIEAYALQNWTQEAYVAQKDVMRAAEGHWRLSKLIINSLPVPTKAE